MNKKPSPEELAAALAWAEKFPDHAQLRAMANQIHALTEELMMLKARRKAN